MKIAIIGAGAAGCFAAANIAAQPGDEVIVFEKAAKALQKVKVSGGGRCNVTHACFDIPELLSRYPRGKQLLRKTLYQFGPRDTINWFEQRGLKLKAEADGRMFPITDDSQSIIDTIWNEMMKQGVQLRYHKAVEKIDKEAGGFTINFADKSSYRADKVLIATGGFPKAEQYKWIQELGHRIQEPVPSLFTFNIPKHPVTALMGLSVANAAVKITGTKIAEQGPLLITHWGMSGPVILRCSAWAARELHARNYDFQVQVNWLGDVKEEELRMQIHDLRRETGKQKVVHKNPFELPKRLWEYLTTECGISDEMRWGDMPAAQQNKLITHMLRDVYEVKGKTTFKEEFVTCGGVSINEVNAQTMESRVVPGLYFAGEILEVDGITGGYNFQHAWSSGWVASRAIIS
ncbi:MAG: flavoprotein [Bacteroidetes bacterium 46-16]|nr:MAG: flavoprotein [Bacteroidetes bacterium 46-16]